MTSFFDGQLATEQATRRPECVSTLGPKRGWMLLLALVQRIREHGAIDEPLGVGLDANDAFVELPAQRAALVLDPAAARGWFTRDDGVIPDPTAELLDLFVPLCIGERATDMVAAHLAQSLDGRVATNSGSSQFISGREDLTHTHRLRALFDAVLVGARTVQHDDPRLTTRLAPGPSPTRVIVDPRGRLPNTHRVFTQPDAPTLLIRGPGHFEAAPHVDVVELEAPKGWIPAATLLRALASRGLRRVFIEGGGITVSGFLEAGALDRLHVTVAPVLMGSGRPSLRLPEIATLDEAMRVPCRHFTLGPDVLFDCPSARPMTGTVTLVAPSLDGPISGGTAFNRAIASGTGARVVETIAEARGFAWVDTLFLREALSSWDARALGLIAHYLPSLVDNPKTLYPSMLRPAETAALAGARAVLCPSAWMAEALESLGARGALRVLEPPLPDGAGVGAMPSGETRLVMVGAVVPGKGQRTLLEALARRPPRCAWSMEVIGSTDVAPAYADACRRTASTLPVRFCGAMSPTSCLQRVRGAHGLVSASVMESYGMAIAEAQACGTPVIALERGNVGTMVGRPGSLGTTNTDELARAVRAHIEDPQLLLGPARANPRTMAPGWTARAAQALAEPD